MKLACVREEFFLTDSQKNSKNKDICFFLSQAKVIREEKIEGQAVRATIGNNGQPFKFQLNGIRFN